MRNEWTIRVSNDGGMRSQMIADEQWELMAPLLPAPRKTGGRPYARGHRATVEAILWVIRTGTPWRDLP